MEPLGRVAGTGSAVVGALSTLISVLLGTLIGQKVTMEQSPRW